jgi:radical SAM superfamily enzyme YgiQ (UPF0313 family)
MTDVLLIYPSVSYTGAYEDIKDDIYLDHPPVGMLYIASALEKHGYSVKVYDTSGDWWKLDVIMEEIRKESPRLIGFSSLTSNSRGVIQLAREIKREYGESITLALGGHHASCDPGILERYDCLDFIVTGEAELTFPKLVDDVIKNGKKVTGVFESETPEDLDELAIPARHLCDFTRYKDYYINSVLSVRGCPYSCAFCSRPAVSNKVRVRESEAVVQEIKDVVAMTGSNMFMFLDDSFTINKAHTVELCNEIIKSGLKIRFNAMTRVNLVDDELLRLIKRAGCSKLLFGVESGNERIRNTIVNKKATNAQIKNAFDLCSKIGLEADMFLMIGFPTETESEIMETVEFPLKVVKKVNMVGIHPTVPLPGSSIWDVAIAEKVIPADLVDRYIRGELGEGFKKSWPRYVPKGLSREFLTEARNMANKRFYFRPRYILYRILKDFRSKERLWLDFKEAYSLLRFGRSRWGD